MKKLLIVLLLVWGGWKVYAHYQTPQTPLAPAVATLTPGLQAVTGALVVGARHTLALADSGEMYGWGLNTEKELGVAGVYAATAPMLLPAPVTWRALHSGDRATYAIATDGQLWRRGFNTWTYVGRDKLAEEVPHVPVFSAQRWHKVQEGWGMGMGLDESGALWAWSEASFSPAPHPDPVADAAVVPVAVASENRWRDFCVNQGSYVAIAADGRMWRGASPVNTGSNLVNEAQAAGVQLDAPLEVAAPVRFQRVFCRPNASHVMALDEQHRLWGYGRNSFGELGDGDGDRFTQSNSVAAIKQVTDRYWIDIAVGFGFTLGIAGDGTLWAWGTNGDGQLGIGNYDYQDKPVQVDARPIWRAVAAGSSSSAALTKDGQIHVWGKRSARGPRGTSLHLLGDGDVAEMRLTPTPVASTVTWKMENGR